MNQVFWVQRLNIAAFRLERSIVGGDHIGGNNMESVFSHTLREGATRHTVPDIPNDHKGHGRRPASTGGERPWLRQKRL